MQSGRVHTNCDVSENKQYSSQHGSVKIIEGLGRETLRTRIHIIPYVCTYSTVKEERDTMFMVDVHYSTLAIGYYNRHIHSGDGDTTHKSAIKLF